MDNIVEEVLRCLTKYRGQGTLNNSIATNYPLTQAMQTFANLNDSKLQIFKACINYILYISLYYIYHFAMIYC